MSKKEIHILKNLIERHLQGLTNKTEDEQLINYFQSYQNDKHWDELLGEKEDLKRQMLTNIRQNIDNDHSSNTENDSSKGRVISLFTRINRKARFYYAAASVLLIVTTFSIYNYNQGGFFFDPQNVTHTDEVIVSQPKNIILTLEDGSQVELEEGSKYSSDYVKGDNGVLIYEKKDNESVSKEDIKYNEITVPRGGRQFMLTLSDSTKLWVNSDSKVKYPVKFQDNQDRIVELVYGEVYFDVSPSKSHNGAAFKVMSGDQLLTVLGTEFNLRAYKDENIIATTLVEGKVAISLNEKEDYKLKPSDQLVFNKSYKSVTISQVETRNFTSWREGVFSFESMLLQDIMKTISRWYDVDIIFENEHLKTDTFSGVIRKQYDLNQTLTIFEDSNLNITYKTKSGTIFIK